MELEIEDLQIQFMVKNHHQSRAIHRVSFYIFKTMLQYKVEKFGGQLVMVNPYNTTQKCSRCGKVKTGDDKLKLKDRVYKCDCGLKRDRDLNAAVNILKSA